MSLTCLDLCQKPFARLDELASLTSQGSEMEQFLRRLGASGIRPKYHKTSNKFSINPIRFRPRSPAHGKGIDLCRSGRDWIVEEFSIADRALVPWLNGLDFYGVREILYWDGHPNIVAWHKRFYARPAAERGKMIPSKV